MPKGEYLQYGGQAIVEGVMMRSPNFFSVACRAPNGQIILQTESLESTWIGRQKWLKWPFFRGSLALVDAMALGIKAMRFATKVQTDPAFGAEPEPGSAIGTPGRVQDVAIGATMIVSLAFGFLIFNFLPNTVAEFSQRFLGNHNGLQINLIAEIVKMTVFLSYVGLIGLLPDVKEVFKYHGAEHKAINTLEADQPLTIDFCKAQTRLHPRCGTSFAIIVLLVGLIVFTFVPRYPITGHQGNGWIDIVVRVGIELVILPLIAGTAYELIRIAGRFRSTWLVNVLFKPGLWSQYLTTREPEVPQIEVALAALKACIDSEALGHVPEVPLPSCDTMPQAV